jgi:hypothetical protein
MKRDLLNEEVDQIINQSFWGKSGVSMSNSGKIQEGFEGAQDQQHPDDQGHVCPLCDHIVSEPISDEKLAEHIELMLSIISEVHNISDEELEAIEEAIEQELSGESEDEDSDYEDSDDEDSDDEEG